MCKISDKLKLCSCDKIALENAQHYWIFSRYQEADDWIEGLIVPPVQLAEEIEQFNTETLERQLNQGNCFDFEIIPQEKDTLELYFNGLFNPDDYLVYSFRFRDGRWAKHHYDVFDSTRAVIHKGCIETAFQVRTKSAT